MRCITTVLQNVLFPHVFLQQLLQTQVVVVLTTAGIPQILSPSTRYYRAYRRHCPHYRGNYRGYRGITAVPTLVSLFKPYHKLNCYLSTVGWKSHKNLQTNAIWKM